MQSSVEIDQKLTELSSLRKSLQGMNLKDKHHATGSILLGVGVGVSILGIVITLTKNVNFSVESCSIDS